MHHDHHNTNDDSRHEVPFTLTDLVNLDLLQRIQDSFATANQVASTITDIYGVPITRTSNHSEVCKLIRASAKGRARCFTSGEALGLKAAAAKIPLHHACLSCGFTDAAAPIIVDGHHIANWLIGQYYVRDVDEQRIIDYAEEIDADREKMLAAFQAMPRLSREQFEKILDFLWLMANEISRMGFLNLQQRRQAKELEAVHQELLHQKNGLEHAVADRTRELQTVNLTLREELIEKNRSQQQQNRLLTAIEKLGEAIAITDVEGNIIYTNPAFSTITGYSAKEALGKNPKILKSGRHPDSFYRDFWKTLLSRGTWSGRLINKKKDGTLYTEESTVSTVRDDHGKVISYVAIKRDITKELELERQLLQAVKLESIGTMAAGIAHEINTPAQYIGSNLEFLDESFSELREFISSLEPQNEISRDRLEEMDWQYLQEEIPKTLAQSREGIRQISSIVLAMKEFANPGSRSMAPTNINKLLQSVIAVSQNHWKYVATMTTQLDPQLPEVNCLAEEISHVFLNIILNGAQAIAEQQEKAGGGAPTGTLTIVTTQEEGGVTILFRDNGPGIPEEIQDKIFDPFFTTKSVGQGTGQGLAIAYDTVVKKHGGTISCRSTAGHGAEFRITLPLAPVHSG